MLYLETSPGLCTFKASSQWGRAYQLIGSEEHQLEVLHYLEWREKQYDQRVQVDVWANANDPAPVLRGALVYIASDDINANANYAGFASLEAIAAQIAVSKGPSGCNAEYLYKLAASLRALEGAEDEELWQLEKLVKSIRGD